MDEQEEVGPDNSPSKHVSISLIAATILCHQMMETDSVAVSDENDDELNDLDGSDVLFPPNVLLRFDYNNEVVPVHGDVNEAVEGCGDPLDRDGVLQAYPAKEESHRMMIEVQETEGGFAKDNEYGVQKLIELGEVEHVNPEIEGSLSSRSAFSIAKKSVVTIFPAKLDRSVDRTNKANNRYDEHVPIVDSC